MCLAYQIHCIALYSLPCRFDRAGTALRCSGQKDKTSGCSGIASGLCRPVVAGAKRSVLVRLLFGRMAISHTNTGYQSVSAQLQLDSPVGVAEKRRGAFTEALKVNTPSPTKPTPAKKPKAEAESYQLLGLDVVLPEACGNSVTEGELGKSDRRSAPVVLVSGSIDDQVVRPHLHMLVPVVGRSIHKRIARSGEQKVRARVRGLWILER